MCLLIIVIGRLFFFDTNSSDSVVSVTANFIERLMKKPTESMYGRNRLTSLIDQLLWLTGTFFRGAIEGSFSKMQ